MNGGLATESQFPGVLAFLQQPRLVVEIEVSGVERGNTRGACGRYDAPTCMQDVAPATDLHPQAGRIVGGTKDQSVGTGCNGVNIPQTGRSFDGDQDFRTFSIAI
ncbi:hypothetical protein D3C86_1871690 [compost metagenome]